MKSICLDCVKCVYLDGDKVGCYSKRPDMVDHHTNCDRHFIPLADYVPLSIYPRYIVDTDTLMLLGIFDGPSSNRKFKLNDNITIYGFSSCNNPDKGVVYHCCSGVTIENMANYSVIVHLMSYPLNKRGDYDSICIFICIFDKEKNNLIVALALSNTGNFSLTTAPRVVRYDIENLVSFLRYSRFKGPRLNIISYHCTDSHYEGLTNLEFNPYQGRYTLSEEALLWLSV